MPQAPRTKSPADTPAAARFSLTIDGVEIGAFAELSLSSAVDPEVLVEGSDPGLRTLPGKRKPPTVTLTRVQEQRRRRVRLASIRRWKAVQTVRCGSE